MAGAGQMDVTVSKPQGLAGSARAPTHLEADAVSPYPLLEQHVSDRLGRAANPAVPIPRVSLADQHGRCGNFEYCGNAVSQRVITIPGDGEFVCPKCGYSLHAISTPADRRNRTSLALLAAVVTLSAATLAYKLTSYSGSSPGSFWALFSSGPTRAAMQDTPPAEQHGPAAPSVLLRLAGSDVIGTSLAPRLAAGYLGNIGSTGIAARPGAAEGQTEIVSQQGSQRDAIVVTLNSTAAGYSMLGRRTADIAMSTTRMSPADMERLSSLGAMTGPATEAVIGLQGQSWAAPAGRSTSMFPKPATAALPRRRSASVRTALPQPQPGSRPTQSRQRWHLTAAASASCLSAAAAPPRCWNSADAVPSPQAG